MRVQKFSGANAGSGEQPIFRGQCIRFRQQHAGQAIKLATESLPSMDLRQRISLQFVGEH